MNSWYTHSMHTSQQESVPFLELATPVMRLSIHREFTVAEREGTNHSNPPHHSRWSSVSQTQITYAHRFPLHRAIRWEDGPHVIQHWTLWLLRFIGTGCKNYATEAVNLIAHLQADFSKYTAYIAIHNYTVNTAGKPGHRKPIDQPMEHYVL